MGGRPSSALALAVVPYGPDGKTEELLYTMMVGAAEVLAAAGAPIVGGHTMEGEEELSLGET